MERVLENPEVSSSGDRVSSGPFTLVFAQGGPLLYVRDDLHEVELSYTVHGDTVMLFATRSDSLVTVIFQLTLEQYDRITNYK